MPVSFEKNVKIILAGTRKDTEYGAVMTQLRKTSRTVHVADAACEWYAEQISHSISAEMQR